MSQTPAEHPDDLLRIRLGVARNALAAIEALVPALRGARDICHSYADHIEEHADRINWALEKLAKIVAVEACSFCDSEIGRGKVAHRTEGDGVIICNECVIRLYHQVILRPCRIPAEHLGLETENTHADGAFVGS